MLAQLTAGAAWGAILMSAFTVAFAVGANGGEGRMSGLLFSALAHGDTWARMAAVATGFHCQPGAQARWNGRRCSSRRRGAVYLAVRVRRWQR